MFADVEYWQQKAREGALVLELLAFRTSDELPEVVNTDVLASWKQALNVSAPDSLNFSAVPLTVNAETASFAYLQRTVRRKFF